MADSWYRWDGEDLLLSVHVQPQASRDRSGGTHGEYLKVLITAPPVDGRANDRLLKFLALEFGVPRRQVALLYGDSGRSKRIRIARPARLPDGLIVAPPGASH